MAIHKRERENLSMQIAHFIKSFKFANASLFVFIKLLITRFRGSRSLESNKAFIPYESNLLHQHGLRLAHFIRFCCCCVDAISNQIMKLSILCENLCVSCIENMLINTPRW